MLQERVVKGWPGGLMVVLLVAGVIGSVALLANSDQIQDTPWLIVTIVLVLMLDGVCWIGLTVVNPFAKD